MVTTIGDYRLIRRIGSGARGEVFRAEHAITRRLEAIKILKQRLPGAEEERGLLREIEIQASLQHPNIAAVHNAFRVPEGLALVMELVEGEPLSAMLEHGRIPLEEGARYVLQTLDALAYAHERGVVHRDVKPSNIVVGKDGAVKLTDFGLAQCFEEEQPTRAGLVAGSPYYMAPEQAVGLAADARSDCYSVGVILYEIATGRRPFEGENAFDVMLQVREAAAAAPIEIEPRISAEMNAAILKAMEKDPARRFQSAVEFRGAVELALGRGSASRNSAGKRAAWRWAALAAATAAVGMSAALMPGLHWRKPAVRQAVPAAPAAVPGSVAPAAAAPVAEPAPEPLQAPAELKPARPRPTAERRSGANPAVRAFVPPVTEPKDRSEEAAADELPPAPDVAPTPAAAPVELPAAAAGPQAPAPPDAPKRRSFLRRVLERIAGSKPKKTEAEAPPGKQ